MALTTAELALSVPGTSFGSVVLLALQHTVAAKPKMGATAPRFSKVSILIMAPLFAPEAIKYAVSIANNKYELYIANTANRRRHTRSAS